MKNTGIKDSNKEDGRPNKRNKCKHAQMSPTGASTHFSTS